MCRSPFLLTESAILLDLSNLPEKKGSWQFLGLVFPSSLWYMCFPVASWTDTVTHDAEKQKEPSKGIHRALGMLPLANTRVLTLPSPKWAARPSQGAISLPLTTFLPLLWPHSYLARTRPCWYLNLNLWLKNSVSYHVLTYPNLLNFLKVSLQTGKQKQSMSFCYFIL